MQNKFQQALHRVKWFRETFSIFPCKTSFTKSRMAFYFCNGGFLDQLIWLTLKVYNWIISVSVDLSWIIIPSLSISTTERLLATISGLLLAPEAVSEWLCTSYQETDKSCYVSKDSLFSDAVAYLKVQDNTVERRHFFETLGCLENTQTS